MKKNVKESINPLVELTLFTLSDYVEEKGNNKTGAKRLRETKTE